MQSLYGVLVPPHTQQTHALQQTNGLPLPSAGSMAPPPDGTFATRDELLNYLKTWAASQGYAIVIGRSRVNRLWLRCDRGGEYRDKHARDPSARQRRRKESRLTGCEFSIKASMRKDGLWRSRCECGEHNHGPSEDLREHPSLRRMTDEQLAKVHELTEAGKSPADIMETLSSMWPDIKVIRRDIYNARKNFKTTRDGASATSSAAPSVSNSVPASATTSFNASFDDSGRMAPPIDTRWPWHDDERVITKKRKLTGSPSRGSESEATQSFNSTTSDGPSAQLALENFSSLPTATASPLQEHIARPSSWSRRSMTSTSRRSSLMSPTTGPQFPPRTADARAQQAGLMQSTSTDFSASTLGTSMRDPGGEFTGTATSHLSGSAAASPSNSPFFPPPRMTMNAGSLNMNYNSPNQSGAMQPHSERRQNTPVSMHPGLRNTPSASPRTSPDMSRRRLSYSLTSGQMSAPQAQSPALSTSNISRPGSSALQQPNSEKAATPSATSALMQAPALPPQASQQQQQQSQTPNQIGQPQPKQSGAVIMQRMQRMEDELKEQKGMLNQILSVVQNLQTSGQQQQQQQQQPPPK